MRRHLEGCPACREKYETMGAAEREVAQKDAPVIDAFAAWNRKAVRRVVLAVAGTVVLIVLALVLRTYVFGTPFRDYELEWTVQDYGSYVDIRVAPLIQTCASLAEPGRKPWRTGRVRIASRGKSACFLF